MTFCKQTFPHSNTIVATQAPEAMMLERGLRDAPLCHCEQTQRRGAPRKPPPNTKTLEA